jgi:hypothetical protein
MKADLPTSGPFTRSVAESYGEKHRKRHFAAR